MPVDIENPDVPDEGEEFDPERARRDLAKKNQENRSLRERLKAAEEKAAKLDEIENAGRPDMEKLTAQVAEYERKAQEADRRALVAEVAHEKGLTAAQAKRLVGGSLEELQADADELLTSFQPQEGEPGGAPPPEGKPTPHLRGGSDPSIEEVPDVKSVLDSISPT